MPDQASPPPRDEGLTPDLSTGERELEAALRSLVPCAPSAGMSVERAAFAAGRASMTRRLRAWQGAAGCSLALCAGVLLNAALRPVSPSPVRVQLASKQPGRESPVIVEPMREPDAPAPTRVVLRDPFTAIARVAETERLTLRSASSTNVAPARIDRASDVLPIRAEAATAGLIRSVFNRGHMP